MARTLIEVFLSSTAKDLAAYREAAYERLRRTGLFHCIRQEDFGAQNAGALEYCRKGAQQAEIFVGLVGPRRGWEPDGDNAKRSITEMEHDWAREACRRRYVWVTPQGFHVPDDLRECDELHARQQAFRQRVIGGGERIVAQTGFDSTTSLASEIVEKLLVEVMTGDLIRAVRNDLGQVPGTSAEDQAPQIAAAVEKLAEDRDIDLLALAKAPHGLDVTELETKLTARAESHEAASERERTASAEYWCHIGALSFLRDTHKSLAAYERAVALDPANPDALRFLGELQYRIGDLASAEATFNALIALGARTADARAQALALTRLSWIPYQKKDFSSAERLLLDALQLSKKALWFEGQARALSNLGNIHTLRGELDRAEEMQLKSLRLDEQLGRKEGMATTYGNLGVIYGERGDLHLAEDMQLKSLRLNEELGRKEGIANSFANLGAIYQTRGDLDHAEDIHLKSLRLNEELGRKEGIADSLWNLSIIHGRRDDTRRTCEYLRKARDLYREIELADKAAEAEKWLRQRGCEET